MTAPRRPDPPVIIRCEQRSIVVKWYPGSPGGAYKYRLQARLVEGLNGIGAIHDTAIAKRTRTCASAGGGGGGGGRQRRSAWGAADGTGGGAEWVTVYEGVDSTAKARKERVHVDR